MNLIKLVNSTYIEIINDKFWVLVTVHHEHRVKREKPTRYN